MTVAFVWKAAVAQSDADLTADQVPTLTSTLSPRELARPKELSHLGDSFFAKAPFAAWVRVRVRVRIRFVAIAAFAEWHKPSARMLRERERW